MRVRFTNCNQPYDEPPMNVQKSNPKRFNAPVALTTTLLASALLSGCGCWPLNETEETKFKWEPQNLRARFSSAETAHTECVSSAYRQCIIKTAALCKSGEVALIRDPISGESMSGGRRGAVCAEAETQFSRDSLVDDGTLWQCKSVGKAEINECMGGKGFEGEDIAKKVCYMKIM